MTNTRTPSPTQEEFARFLQETFPPQPQQQVPPQAHQQQAPPQQVPPQTHPQEDTQVQPPQPQAQPQTQQHASASPTEVEGSQYNWDDNKLVVVGFTVGSQNYRASLNSLPKGSRNYEEALMGALSAHVQKLVSPPRNVDVDDLEGEYDDSKEELTELMLSRLGIENKGGKIKVSSSSQLPSGATFLALKKGTGKLGKDYDNEKYQYVALNHKGMRTKLNSVILQRWRTAINLHKKRELERKCERPTKIQKTASTPQRPESRGLPVFKYVPMPPDCQSPLDRIANAGDAFRAFEHPDQFYGDYDRGKVAGAMRRLGLAKPKDDLEAEEYARRWALALDQDKSDNQEELLSANHLDADRKICLLLL